MELLSILYVALGLSALIFAIGVVIAFLGIQKSMERNMERLTHRLEETLRQLEITAEELRKTNFAIQGVIANVDHATANFAHLTNGVRNLRGAVDVATKVIDRSISPTLVGFAGLVAGFKAAGSHIAQRISGYSEKGGGK